MSTKSFVRSIKNATKGFSSTEVKVRNATSNDPSGPSTYEMEDIARLTRQHIEFFEIMDTLDKRMNDKGKNWRHVMKSLIVLDYIIHCGSEDVIRWCKDNLYIIKTLREFHFIDVDGQDHSVNVRRKATEITALLQDDERLRSERADLHEWKQDRRHRSNRRLDRNSRENSSEDIRQAILESKRTAREEEARRQNRSQDQLVKKDTDGSDDFSRAFQTMEEKSRTNSTVNLNDPFNLSAQQQQGQVVVGQPIYQAVDMYGNPFYSQQTMPTGILQNAYSTGGIQNQYINGYQQQQLYQQQLQLQESQQSQQAIAPLKTGTNNPFAQIQMNLSTEASRPSLNELELQHQQIPVTSSSFQYAENSGTRNQLKEKGLDHEELNILLATGTGVDTYGNTGDIRLPSQHTKTDFVHMGLNPQQTAGGSKNPFIDHQYTGVPSANLLTPAFTGYGFGNAPQY
ncbi:ENTH-domain-containing protein [Nadsonia fulvescens var. elongata DSM 6958]|uniref:ENTH-domain-containing protein n=1 Tax=Nadsonia fulvescens var. elongata DSM 6958 TaxID=857566 RepID=A0A1E3PKS2_9ASCO|nr:ENTH-domain-containing protein [Nadsonia fulvescens var. elongata DSM 6958]